MMMIWTLFCGVILGALTLGLIATPSRIDDLIGVWLAMIAAFIVAINYVTWQIIGKESIQISKEFIEVYNSGTWFKRRLKINFYEFEDLNFEQDSRTPHWIEFWGIGGGKISIHYLGRRRKFGQDLSEKQAIDLFEKLQNEIEEVQSRP